ncbi:17888_t:CDS:10, partial [Acaulospora morrowiae]
MAKCKNPNLSSLRTLIVDNYDSYTFNLLQLWDNEESVGNVVVVRNDQFSWTDFTKNILPNFDNIIISPGPGSPENVSDFGICSEILKLNNIPILGVCLGHQGIGFTFGGEVTNGTRIMHGRLSPIYHEGTSKADSLFSGIPSPFLAVRYHSLVINSKDFPSDLQISAWCPEVDDLQECSPSSFLPAKESSTVMGLQHAYKPIYGVQFHPESICTEYGFQILRNFQLLSRAFLERRGILFPRPVLPEHIKSFSVVPEKKSSLFTKRLTHTGGPMYNIIMKKLEKDIYFDSSLIFQKVVSADNSKVGIWWLDSSKLLDPQSRFSYMGSTPVPSNSFSISYNTLRKKVIITCSDGRIITENLSNDQTYWDWMSGTMEIFNQHITGLRIIHCDGSIKNVEQRIPFDFRLGMVGYFGYDMKRESMPGYIIPKDRQSSSCTSPDAAFIFATQAIIFDHVEKRMWLAGLARDGPSDLVLSKDSVLGIPIGRPLADLLSWINSTEKQLRDLQKNIKLLSTPPANKINRQILPRTMSSPFMPDLTKDFYLRSIEKAKSYICEGQSYEICLTTQFRASLTDRLQDIFGLYYRIRSNNPAPFSALIHFSADDITILSSSPEKFLQIDNEGIVEMKPIKGTVARAKGCCCPRSANCNGGVQCELIRNKNDMERKRFLEGDIKEQAENLMIVDLIRNDLAQICPPHTVKVPYLMKTESYETVHQLVTTVRGNLRDSLDCIKAIRGCFPPGSMTGAPKLRSVQLLDELEHNTSRGIYSGCLGYISLQDGSGKQKGTACFNVIIRTVVVRSGK